MTGSSAEIQIDESILLEMKGNKCRVSQTGVYGQIYMPYQDVMTEETSKPVYHKNSGDFKHYEDELFSEDNFSYRVSVKEGIVSINVYENGELIHHVSDNSRSPLDIVHNNVIVECNQEYLDKKNKKTLFSRVISVFSDEEKSTKRRINPKRKEGSYQVANDIITGADEIQNFLNNDSYIMSRLDNYALTQGERPQVIRIEKEVFERYYLGKKMGCTNLTTVFDSSDKEILNEVIQYDYDGSCVSN